MIKFNDIAKSFISGAIKTEVLRGVSFKVDKGEFVSIMAPSGTGKTTLLNVIGCLMKATSGSYLFEGHDIETLNDDQLSEIRNKKIGFVFQTLIFWRKQVHWIMCSCLLYIRMYILPTPQKKPLGF